MTGSILGLAVQEAPFIIRQEHALKRNQEIYSLSESQKEQVRKLYENSGITKRHAVINDFNQEKGEWDFLGNEYPRTIPGMTRRNEIYKKEAPKMALQAAQKALVSWGGDPSTITHVISVSCTGVYIPGIEFTLIDHFKMKRNTSRLGINFMGCFGAFKGLQVANSIAKENPKHRILIVCTELCSLHINASLEDDGLTSNSIFADGSGSAIVGQAESNERPLFEILSNQSHAMENTRDQMSWDASDHGFLMTLSGYVPINIARHIKSFTENILQNIHPDECDFAIHPGGKAILQVIEKKLKLDKSQTASAWETLKEYGNMSSATFLFVLNHLLSSKQPRPYTVGLGFGPGLSVEGILLKNFN